MHKFLTLLLAKASETELSEMYTYTYESLSVHYKIIIFCSHTDWPFIKSQNKLGVIASVQLIRAIETKWRDMNRFELLIFCKDLVFCFIRQMTVCSQTLEIMQSDCHELKEARDQNSQKDDDLFAQKQLYETIQVVSTWMDKNHYRSKDLSSLRKELKVLHSISFTRLVYLCNS